MEKKFAPAQPPPPSPKKLTPLLSQSEIELKSLKGKLSETNKLTASDATTATTVTSIKGKHMAFDGDFSCNFFHFCC